MRRTVPDVFTTRRQGSTRLRPPAQMTPISLGRSLVTSALLVGAPMLLAACGSSGATSDKSLPASVLVSRALHDAVHAGWVHEKVLATEPGHIEKMENEVGAATGRQQIDVDGALSTTEVVGGDVYLRGDKRAVVSYFEIPTKDPQAIANKWISITPSEPGFSTVSAAVTLSSDFTQVRPLGPFHKGKESRVNGIQVVPIYGHVRGPSGVLEPTTLYVTVSGTVLPIEYTLSYKRESFVTKWSDWGQSFTIVAPKTSISISAIL